MGVAAIAFKEKTWSSMLFKGMLYLQIHVENKI